MTIIIGASILSKRNDEIKNEEVSRMQNAYLISSTGTVLECPDDKKEVLVQVDDPENDFLYDEITLVYTGPSSDNTIDSLVVGEKIKFSYFPDEPTDKETLNCYIIH